MRPGLSDAEEAALVEELAEALERAVDASGCPDMLPLYLRATERERGEWLRGDLVRGQVPEVSPALRALGKASWTKYGCLAAWRHAVLWRRLVEALEGDFRAGVQALYFTPYPDNAPPYAWTRRSSDAPLVGAFHGPNDLDEMAREGCWRTVQALREQAAPARWAKDGWAGAARQAFVKAAIKRRTLREVLRLEAHWEDDHD